MTMLMDSRTALSDSNDISNGSSICCVAFTNAPTAAVVNASLSVDPDADTAALNRLSDNLESLFNLSLSDSDAFADAKIVVSGDSREVLVHRCVLSSRSPFFRAEFASKREKEKDKEREKLVTLELKEMADDFKVGFDALVAVIRYLYTGKARPLPRDVCACVDDECPHDACRPTVDFLVEVLYLSRKFEIVELLGLHQRRLLDNLDKVTADDILVVLSVAEICGSSCERLLGRCIDLIVKYEVDVTTLESLIKLCRSI